MSAAQTDAPAGTGRRIGIVAIDQMVSGGSNVLASIIAARLLDAHSFGIFGLVFLVYSFVQTGSRAVIANPILVQPRRAQERLGAIMGSGWLYGLVGGALLILAAGAIGFWDRPTAIALGVLGICTPLLNLQDLGRYVGIGFRRPVVSLVLDLIWLVLLLVLVAVMVLTGQHNMIEMVAAWAGTGAVAGVCALWVWRAPHSRPSVGWLVESWRFSWRFAVAFAAVQLGVLVVAGLVRSLYGSAVLGAYVGAQLLMRPYNTLEVALVGSSIAEIAHSPENEGFVRHHTRRITMLAVGVAVANALAMVFLPDFIGRQLLGDTWHLAQIYVPAFAAQLLFIASTTGPRAGLAGVGLLDRNMRVALVLIPLLVAAAAVGAVASGSLACAWGISAGWAVAALLWWWSFLRRPTAARPGPRHRRTRNRLTSTA